MTQNINYIYPTLYKLNNNNKIYQWDIKIEKVEEDFYKIITSHGIIDGKMISHEYEIKKGKAKNSVLEQSILEAKRKWINKKEKELYTPDLNSFKNQSEKNLVIRPMLANKFSFELYSKENRSFKIGFPAYVQRKYDGIRCIAYLKNGNVILESRKGIPFENFDLLKNELLNILPNGYYFDGELYTNQLDFEVISGLIRLTNKKCTNEQQIMINMIEFHIYDFFNINEPNMIYDNRKKQLNEFLNMNKLNLCKSVETYTIFNLNDIKNMHDNFIKEGFEGIMIRDPNGIYELNKRSKFLQKYKEFIEEEFIINGFHEGTGDEKGIVIWDCITKDNKSFAVRPKGSFDSRKNLFENGSKYIGKKLTVIFQEYSNDGIPRFPVGKAIRDIY
jgi:DNA ligase-1